MALDKLKYFLDGPGEVLVVATDFNSAAPDISKIFAVVTAKTAAFRGSATEEKVTGGRSLAPRRKFLTDREITFELSDCEMDFRYIELSQGETMTEGSVVSWAFGEEEQYVPDSDTKKFSLNHTPIEIAGISSLVLQDVEGNLFSEAASTPGPGEYTLTDAEIEVNEADKYKEFKAIYQYNTPTNTRQVSTFNDSLPKTVKLLHHQPMFNEDNQKIGIQEIEIYRAAIEGEFEEAFEERTAFAPSLTFEVIDPKRPDKKLVDHRFIPIVGDIS